MITKNDVDLKSYSSFNIGGTAKLMFTPETIEELKELILKLEHTGYYLLGNGTNILFSDRVIQKPIINLRKFSDFISLDSDLVEVGASCNLQKFLSFCASNGFAAPFQLATIPGSIGGAIYMNAARGGNQGSISDDLVSVKYLCLNKEYVYNNQSCKFGYRNSIFQNFNHVIISAKFKYKKIDKNIAKKELRNALSIIKERDYFKYPSAGSVFKRYNHLIMRLLSGLRIGNAKFSSEHLNIIINIGGAKYKDVNMLIYIARVLHLIFMQKCSLEIIIIK